VVTKHIVSDKETILRSDLAGEYPLYVYLSPDREYLLYANSIAELLEHDDVPKPLEITNRGVSFLLQSGTVPPPHTVYKDIYVVGIGDSAEIKHTDGKITLNFSHNFPFRDKYRDKEGAPDETHLLELMAEATISRLDESKPTYLFHSAGKDSNTIALAMAEAGYQDKITCITHQSKGEKDESEISRKIAAKLGYKHQTVPELKSLDKKHIDSIYHYFENLPLPSTDNVTLAYPLYATQFDFQGKNILDGCGNDVYMGYLPDETNYKRAAIFSKLHPLRPITGRLSSAGWLSTITRTRSEWTGMFGLSYGDTKKILPAAEDIYPFWREEDRKRADWDYLDLRSDIRGCITEPGIFQLKVRLSASIYDNNLILPFTNEKVATYLWKLPSRYLYDKKHFKNKLILRKMLKERIGLDSDKLGKMAYVFDFYAILMLMRKEVDEEILSCGLWDSRGVTEVLDSFYRKIAANPAKAEKITTLLQRLYLISIWYNQSRYVKREK
jgi:asparagine synthase (glutamine-hydrolysing)